MSATDAVARMLTLVPWLLERPGASVSETAEAFGVEQRTIRRDLEALDFCGLPGLRGGDLFEVTIVGDRIVVRMADELRRPLRLTPREALRLVLTVDAVADVFGGDLPALRTAVEKVRTAAGVPPGVHVELDPGGSLWLEPLREALRAGVQVELGYRGRNDIEPARRLVDPWALHVADGAWYLQGNDVAVGERRTFRLDRVVAVERTDTPVQTRAPEGQLPAPAYTPGSDDVPVTLFLAPAARWVLDAVTPDEVVDGPDGGAEVTFRTDAPRWVTRLVLTAGGAARVIAPDWLGDQVAEAARAAAERYAEA